MKKNSLILIFLFTLVYLNAFSMEINIADVHRNIPLADDEPVYKDFYLNAGEGSGLKKNLVVTVKRKMMIKDSTAKSVGDFETVVGQLRIIQIDTKIAVAREYKLFSRDEEPMIEQIGMMTGDRVDLMGSFIDATKPAKKKVAETALIEPQTRFPAESSDSQKQAPLKLEKSPIKLSNPIPLPEI